jgi:hypothetical protein
MRRPVNEDEEVPVPPPSDMQEIIDQAKQDLNERDSDIAFAAYLQAAATLKLAEEMARLRRVLESGEGALTVGIEPPS